MKSLKETFEDHTLVVGTMGLMAGLSTIQTGCEAFKVATATVPDTSSLIGIGVYGAVAAVNALGIHLCQKFD